MVLRRHIDMDDSDKVERRTDDTEDVIDNKAWPPAVAGGNVTGNEATSSGMGTLAGGLVGAIAARDIVDREIPEEERVVADSDTPDIFGEKNSQTGDQGVSPAQKEAEADELNG
jgi:hypothetical protein